MIKMVSSPEKSLGNIDSSSQEECPQPTVQEIAAYSARLIGIADSAVEAETETTEYKNHKITIRPVTILVQEARKQAFSLAIDGWRVPVFADTYDVALNHAQQWLDR
jgi:hypothetical protein